MSELARGFLISFSVELLVLALTMRFGNNKRKIAAILAIGTVIAGAILVGFWPKGLLQKIDFTYSDSPENHGWKIIGKYPNFISQTDGFQGTYLIVEPSDDYAMSIDVDKKALNGTNIEFVSKYDANAAVYALVKMTGQNQNSSKEGWLKFLPGTRLYNKVDDNEWEVHLDTFSQGGGWYLFNIDPADAVHNTYGDQGWQYSQILGFRVRGKIELAYIAIYK